MLRSLYRFRIFRPNTPLVGSNVSITGSPRVLKTSASNLSWVDFPDPSIPSKTMNTPGTGSVMANRRFG
jgi:hypothetical protein